MRELGEGCEKNSPIFANSLVMEPAQQRRGLGQGVARWEEAAVLPQGCQISH